MAPATTAPVPVIRGVESPEATSSGSDLATMTREPLQLMPPPARVDPLSAESYRIQFTASNAMHDKLRYAQGLLRHQIPSGDPAEVFDTALDVLIIDLEYKCFGKPKSSRKLPRPKSKSKSNTRTKTTAPRSAHIPR